MKPSWDDSPEWAKWVAQDESGRWYWHEYEPETDNYGEWISIGQVLDVYAPHWLNTKEPRP